MKYWARCFIAWTLDFGLKSTSPHESMHSSVKRFLGGRRIQLNEFPSNISLWYRKVLKNRTLKQFDRDRTVSAIAMNYIYIIVLCVDKCGSDYEIKCKLLQRSSTILQNKNV